MCIEAFGFLNLFGSVHAPAPFLRACSFQLMLTSSRLALLIGAHSDFFPVILNFMRQLPVIGTFLSLPYIRGVRGSLSSPPASHVI